MEDKYIYILYTLNGRERERGREREKKKQKERKINFKW
jgi:hypothetical protein